MSPLALLALLGAFDAPITVVTVFTDQARVVRTGAVTLSGPQALELPPLPDTIDVSSLKVEASGAEVRRVDLARLTPERLRTAEARAVLVQLDRLDAELGQLERERGVEVGQRDALAHLLPTLPQADLKGPPPRLDGSGWTSSASFAAEQLSKVLARLRELDVQVQRRLEQRALLAEQARALGNPERRSGWQVVAQLAGSGPATVTITYLVRNARWVPTWDLQLQPDTNTVNLTLAGVVNQVTSEDWTGAQLVLSTAVPSAAVAAPQLATWKIGVADRFIPTPTPVVEVPVPAPRPVPRGRGRSEEDLLRAQLNRVRAAARPAPAHEEVLLEAVIGDAEDDSPQPHAPPPPAPPPPAEAPGPARFEESEARSLQKQTATVEVGSSTQPITRPMQTFSLSPPPAWSPPHFGPDSPVTLAQGYDLAFPSLQRETVPSGAGARRVALWSARWPVTVERQLYPALTQDAFLVAELKNPSTQVLPGGPAQLYVGADPAGTARLDLVSPGEPFTLPLGIDRALRPVRNVKLVETTQGLISREEVGTYAVSIELTNPYRAPVALRVFDQWPLSTQKELQARLVESRPVAIQDPLRGHLEWRLTLAPQQKVTLSFTYTLQRPRGWKLGQAEAAP